MLGNICAGGFECAEDGLRIGPSYLQSAWLRLAFTYQKKKKKTAGCVCRDVLENYLYAEGMEWTHKIQKAELNPIRSCIGEDSLEIFAERYLESIGEITLFRGFLLSLAFFKFNFFTTHKVKNTAFIYDCCYDDNFPSLTSSTSLKAP